MLLLIVGVLLFGTDLPATAAKWWTFAWVLLFGALCSTLLGVALSSLPRSARSAAAVINLPFIILQFISGVYIPFRQLPEGLQTAASFFPLKWLAQAFAPHFCPTRS